MSVFDNLAQLDADRLQALSDTSTSMPDLLKERYQNPRFQLMLKKKRLESVLMQALRDQGDGDLAKIARFRRVPSEGGI